MLGTTAVTARSAAPAPLGRRHPPARRLLAPLLLVLAGLGLLAGPMATRAAADGTASAFVVDARLGFDGTLTVKQTVTFAATAPGTLTQRLSTRQNLLNARQYVYSIGGVTATSGGKDLAPTVATSSDATTVTVKTAGLTAPVVMGYTVRGAVVKDENGATALRWRLLQGLSADVRSFDARVAVPTQFSYIRCTAGPPNSVTPCAVAEGGTEGADVPHFADGPRGQGETVGVDIGFQAGALAATEKVDELWTVGRAFSVKPWPLALALGLLVLGGALLFALHRRNGADARPGDQIVRAGEFVPVGPGQSEFRVVGDVRPGHVGTVVDERVDPIDVTASLLDLAVRGHLLITELPRASDFAPTDWVLRRLDGADELRPFEAELLDALGPQGSEVRVSQLSDAVYPKIGDVQSKLYDEVVSHGWFKRRPDATRNTWTQVGLLSLILAVVMTGVLAAFTSFGLAGLALVAIALGLIFVGQAMPARTVKGSALLSGLQALRSELLTHPTDQMPQGQELRELSEVLPYAVVLGGADRWLQAIVAADADTDADSDDLSWYHGPQGWHLRHLPSSLQNFITTVSGTLFAR